MSNTDATVVLNHIYLDGQEIATKEEESQTKTVFIPQPLAETFDAEEVFSREVYRDNPIMQDMKRWITDDLKQPLNAVSDIILQGHMVELPEKVTEGPFKKFENTPFMSFIVLFHDGTYRVCNVNMDDYHPKAGEA